MAIEYTINPAVAIDIVRCYDCGRYWGFERGFRGQCPICADRKIQRIVSEAERNERVVRSLRGALTRTRKRRGNG